MSIILTFVALGCRTNFEGIMALVSIVTFKTLTLDVIPDVKEFGY